MSKDHCDTPDWSKIGPVDASRLRPVEWVIQHQKVCGSERVNEKAYREGYVTQMKTMCADDDSFIFGYLYKKENPACPKNLEFDKAYS